jgi:hypothetical protein
MSTVAAGFFCNFFLGESNTIALGLAQQLSRIHNILADL